MPSDPKPTVYVTTTTNVEMELTDENIETILTDYFCRVAGIDDRAAHDVVIRPVGKWPTFVSITLRRESSTRPKVQEEV